MPLFAATFRNPMFAVWQLVTAASYIEADVSAWQLVTAASYIEGDVSPVSAGGRKKNVFLLKMHLKKLTMQIILYSV